MSSFPSTVRRPLAFAALLALSAGAMAQAAAPVAATAQTGEDSTLQKVIVTGSSAQERTESSGSYRARQSNSALGLDLSLRETPQAISVVTRAQMNDFGLRSVNDVLSVTPGVIVEKVETDRTYYTARGFDITNFQLDGIGLPFTNGAQWGDVDTAVYDRVDVLRGANGMLSGTGNPSATVNFIRKKPTSAFQASAAVTLGSWNDKRVESDVSDALTEGGAVRGRLVVAREKADSYLDRHSRDKTVVLGALDFDLGSSTLLSLSHIEQRSNADSPMWGALPLTYADGSATNYDVSTSTSPDWAWWNNRDARTTAELTHDFGNGWDARAVATHRLSTTDSELFYVFGSPVKGEASGLYGYPSAFGGTYRQDLLNFQLSGPFELAGRRHQLVVGASVARENAVERSGYAEGYSYPIDVDLATWNGQIVKPAMDVSFDGSDFLSRRYSLFTVGRFNLADDLKLIAGGNLTRVVSSGENYGVAHDYSKTVLTPYLGVVKDLGANLSAYASFTRIFNPQTEVDATNKTLAPIQGRNLELGLKSEWLNKTLTANAAIFETHQQNTAEYLGFVNGVSVYQGTNAVSRGIELELAGRLASGWDISTGLTALTLKDDDSGEDARVFTPRNTLRVTTSYQLASLPGLRLGASYKWQDKTATTDGLAHQAAYGLLGLMASYDFNPHLNLAVNLENVTNQKYLTSLYWTQSYYGAPRHGSATLRWTY